MDASQKVPQIAVAMLMLGAMVARADDTDIYINPTPPPGSDPMVMFSIDYRPNLASIACTGDECDSLIAEGYLPVQASYTFFDVLRAVLRKVMEPLEDIKVGLMLNHDHRNNCAGPLKAIPNCSNGGYIGRGFQSFTLNDSNQAKANFHQYLADVPLPQGNQSHSYQGKELFFEFYRYLSGQGVYNGHVGFTDYFTNGATNLNVDNPAIDWDTSIENVLGTQYVTPILNTAACSRIFTVNIMFQVANQEADSDNAIKAGVGAGGMGLSGTPTFPTVIKWLHDSDLADGAHGTAPTLEGKQNVTSFFIVDPTKINTTTTAYAQAGGTGVPLPLDGDPEKLIATLNDIFKQILSVSTTFVAASVPVNVFNRAEIVDNVYLALFQPNGDAQPTWNGNVKKLRISGLDESNPVLVDANDNAAVAADGRIRFSALTFWTDGGSLPDPDPLENEVDGADGRAVHRGGAGQKIPGYMSGGPGAANGAGGRQIFYDDGSSLAPLNADDATATDLQAALGAASPAEALALLQYARGQDVDDLDEDGNVTEARPWLMGDPLHSRPLPINYGARDGYTASNQAIFIAVAGNDGMLHFIRNTTTGGNESGEEVWAFMPQRAMDKLSTLRANAAGVKHPYLLDGSPVIYTHDDNNNGTIDSGEVAYLFIGMGRGGRAYYAFDISDPESPDLLWTLSDTGSFADLGYTLADPRVVLVNTGSGVKPALVLSGGYDLNKDLRDGVGTDDTYGNAIFVVDAETGELIWRAVGGSDAASATTFEHPQLVDSISSTAAVMDSDGNGVHDRIYVGDTGGNVWRADIGGTDTSEWRLTLLAALGRHAAVSPTKVDDRRFHHRPDVVQGSDADGPYDAVLVGSGDRPDPLDVGGVVNNWFYMIKDRNVTPNSGQDVAYTPDDLGDVTNSCIDAEAPCDVDLEVGWRLRLMATGEKSLATPITIGGTVFFTTYLPPGASPSLTCAPSEGSGRLYAVRLRDAAAVRDYDTSTEESERYTDLNSQGIPAEVVSLPPDSILRPDLTIEPTSTPTRFETYWFEAEE